MANVSEELLSFSEEIHLQHLFKLAQSKGIFRRVLIWRSFIISSGFTEAIMKLRWLTGRERVLHHWLSRAAETMDEELTDTTYGWSQLAEGSLEIEVVTGNHFTMLEEPHVSLLAQKLRVRLAQPS